MGSISPTFSTNYFVRTDWEACFGAQTINDLWRKAWNFLPSEWNYVDDIEQRFFSWTLLAGEFLLGEQNLVKSNCKWRKATQSTFVQKCAREMLVKSTLGVNFINVLPAAFEHVDPKSVKRYWGFDWILTLLGSTSVKAIHRRLMKLSPGGQFHQHWEGLSRADHKST